MLIGLLFLFQFQVGSTHVTKDGHTIWVTSSITVHWLEAHVVSHLLVFFLKACFWFQLFFSLQNHNTLICKFMFFFQCFASKQKHPIHTPMLCHVLHPQLQVLKFGTIYKPPVIACDDTCSALSTLLIGIYSDTSFMSACAQTAN